MPLKYPTLFSPFKIGNLEVKNRICMSAMDTAGWYDSNGLLTDAGINYYEARAKGGVGLIHTGSNRPNFDFAGGGTNTASPFKDAKAFVFMHKKLADRVHAYGTSSLTAEDGWPSPLRSRAAASQRRPDPIAGTVQSCAAR